MTVLSKTFNRTSIHLHMGSSCNCCLRDGKKDGVSWTLQVLAKEPQRTPKAYEAGRRVADAMNRVWGNPQGETK